MITQRTLLLSVLLALAALVWIGAEMLKRGAKDALATPDEVPRVVALPEELVGLQNADPIADCEAAVRKGDFRFLAMRGYSTYIPGMENDTNLATRPEAFRVIEGTGDVIYGHEHARLQGCARDYARRYNCEMRKRLPLAATLEVREQ
jgi:hypothetical protein